MEREVWKFNVEPYNAHPDPIRIPADAEIVSVGTQEGRVVIWALVRPDASRTQRRFAFFPTGVPVPEGCTYVGTAHVLATPAAGGSLLVWHVFEEPPE